MKFDIFLMANFPNDILFIATSKRGLYDREELCLELEKLIVIGKYPYIRQFRTTLNKLAREKRKK